MKKGDILDLEISGYAFEGKGIAKIVKEAHSLNEEPKKFVVFVDGAYPGDVLSAQVRKIRKSYAEARIKTLHKESSLRTSPHCNHFGTCGGCKSQNLLYHQQAKFKEEQVKDIFERLGGLKNFELLPIVKSEKIYFYRNKLEYSFADRRWLSENEINSMQDIPDRNFALGFHIPGMYDKVLNIEECHLQSQSSNKILNFTRNFFKERNVSIYSTKIHEGFLRNLVIKEASNTADLMVNLVVNQENDKLLGAYKEMLLSEIPSITTLIFNISKKKATVAIGDYEIAAHGSGFIIDKIGKSKYRISANSFFQTNTLQAENLYNTALDFACFTGNEIVYDLYSGAGTIPIFISDKVKQIYGFESVEPAIQDAFANKELNSVYNYEPILADLNKSFLSIVEEKHIPKPDAIITDPPRSGMHTKTVDDILKLSPAKIVYVSCNPATQARDIKLLCDGGYKLVKIQPVDMFPHTYHIENVALLTK
ncbi:MAG: RNA methyltransferase TrmA family [Ignavibacteria bacterium]|nr:MAG: RNA methyltransferase TrmA family [Ignavibacteria bacterium]KAF0160097.1 MAG: RNA methyltransferase TrmA family [Ignavibacteria bacterium]